jgi:hypothetical protein
MNKKLYENLESWTEKDLEYLPEEEDDFYEYKSSRIISKSFDELKKKISVAASAFWNSGGGVLIVGVDNKGKIDGGIPKTINKQALRDWVDQIILKENPLGTYKIKIIERKGESSLINPDKAVLIILFERSYDVHMAYDYKYYIRSGAHSNPANNFLVEALRSRRGLLKPLLRGLLKFSQHKPHVVQLVILTLNDATALDVKITFNPLPKALEEYYKDKFPLEIPAIDKSNPFIMDLYVFGIKTKTFGERPVKLVLNYSDIIGNNFKYSQIISPELNLSPMLIENSKNK